jgi:hypothetical protein
MNKAAAWLVISLLIADKIEHRETRGNGRGIKPLVRNIISPRYVKRAVQEAFPLMSPIVTP